MRRGLWLMALLPFPVASLRVYGCLLSPFSLLDYGVPCALLPPCQPLLGGCCQEPKERVRKVDVPSLLK